jgi:uncharacterized repeat protein (TIGR03803 family)
MRGKRSGCRSKIEVLALILLSAFLVGTAWAQNLTALYTFNGGKDGYGPLGPIVVDSAGNIYGTTQAGGVHSGGTVYELTPSGNGWTQTILHSFSSACEHGNVHPDGCVPSGLIADAAGNLYGATWGGGPYNGGVVFELTKNPKTKLGWTYHIIWDIGAPQFADYCNCAITFDSHGNLFGVAQGGPGTWNRGEVFELSHVHGKWTQTALYYFNGVPVQGQEYYAYPMGSGPLGAPVVDPNGNVYGTTYQGGTSDTNFMGGTLWELTPSDGAWNFTLLHTFTGDNDGAGADSPLILDSTGNIFGTTLYGGPSEFGDVFEFSPSGSGWTETMLHDFDFGDGGVPLAGLTSDAAGNLYGTAVYGGNGGCPYPGCGVVYELSPSSSGHWTRTTLHDFTGVEGNSPESAVVLSNGNLYGATYAGGYFGAGVIYEIGF